MSDFVNFKLAQKLKEKGFNEPCFGWYYATPTCQFDHKENIVFNHSELRGATYDDLLLPSQGGNINAPTISQVLKWLRKEKHIHINTSVYKDESEDADGRVIEEWRFWNWDIQNCNSGDVLQDGDDIEYESYEQAALAGIEYVLNNLI